MIKVCDVKDWNEYTVEYDTLNERFYVIDEYGETVDEGSTGMIELGTYYGVESTYIRM